jgi:hypothetical protein
MNQETANYLVRYFPNLYNETEMLAKEHMEISLLLDTPEAIENHKALYGKDGSLSEDKEVLKLVELSEGDFNLVVAARMLRDHKDQIHFNYCEKCNALARTPCAKQCRYCGHDWH